MTLTRRSALALGARFGAAGGLAALGLPAAAQEAWPAKPVKVVVAGGGGSATDITARIVLEPIAKKLGQPFVIDNRPGANGILATEGVMRSPKDGYTILFTYAAAQVVNQSLYPRVPYDGDKDFAAVAQIGSGGNLLVVPAGTPAKDLKELVAWVKAKPADEVAYGSWGIGSGGHLSMEALIQRTGARMRHVPYKTTPAMLTDMIGGHLSLGFSAVANALPLIKSGKIRALAYSAPTRHPMLPEVPTMGEQGVPFDLVAWFGVFAPAGTPAAIVNQLNREILLQLQSAETLDRLKAQGFADNPLKTPAEFAETVRRDIKEWGDVVRKGNIKPE